MAEIAVLIAIKKISIAMAGEILHLARPILAKKADLVMVLPANMELIKEELELIHAFLNQIGMKECSDKVLETWITQVRRLAYDIEDIVDQFIYVVGEHKVKGSWDFLKKIVKKPRYLFSIDEIATDVENVKNKLKGLSERRDRWILPTVGGLDIPVPNKATEQPMYLYGHIHPIDEDKLVGISENREKLTKLLHSEDSASHILSVWGMGGLGKSTLVRHVYNREGSKFHRRAWIFVPESYQMDNILREMLTKLYGEDNKPSFDVENLNIFELIEELKKLLGQQRCLIILDDVWKPESLPGFRDHFVDQGHQSRVIVTTRSDEVASIANDGCKIKLEPLNEHDAWSLLCKKAFLSNSNHICPPGLERWGKEIVKKCEGLPLALVAVGSLLSLRTKSEAEWKRVHDELILQLHDNSNLNYVEKILNLSYRNLPNYLKNCFLYCSMFPENYLLPRKKLIRLLVAEGFVEKRGESSLEEAAEGYLEELVRRSMLQAVERNSFGRLRRLRMHDLVRELAIFLSKKESFNLIYNDTSEAIKVGSDSRHLSVLRCKNNIPLSTDKLRLRTFLAFDVSMPLSSWSSFIPSKTKYLTALDLSGLPIVTIPSSVGELFNLKYLCLDFTHVESLPRSVTKLQNLETLSLRRAQLLNLPHGFAKLKKLRHLLIWKTVDDTNKSFSGAAGVEAFDGLWNMEELQSLNEVRANEDLIGKLGNMTQLRSLSISDVKNSYCAQLCSSLSKMHKLSSLQMKASDENEVLELKALTSPPPTLQSLELTGRLAEGTLESPLFLALGNTLKELSLRWCQFTETPIPFLSKLSNLTSLFLRRAYGGEILVFHEGCFPNLKKLFLRDFLQVHEIHIENGALVNLEILGIIGLTELRTAHIGIEFLSSIQEAYFSDVHPDLEASLNKVLKRES